MTTHLCVTCHQPIPVELQRKSMFCAVHNAEFEKALDNREPIKDRENGETILSRIFERHV